MTQTTPVVSEEVRNLIESIKRLRAEMPEFKPNDTEVKDMISAYQSTLFILVNKVRELMGFESYNEALMFVDTSIKRAA